MANASHSIRAAFFVLCIQLLLSVTASAQSVADFRHDTDFELLSKTPRFHLMLTANADYGSFPDLSLPGTLKDADSIRDLFAKTLAYDDISDKADQTVLSYNDFFTRQLPAAVNKIEDGDVFVFYFSGHGFSYRNQNYIVPKQFPDDPTTMLGNAIKVTDIVNEVAKRKRPSAIILIIDACRTDLALPASIDQSFDQVAFKLPTPGLGSPEEKIKPDPRQYTVVWFPTGPLSAAVAREDTESPFTAALVNAVKEKSKNWKMEHSVPVLAADIQAEYDRLVGETGIKTVDHIESSNRPTAIPNLKVSEELQSESDGEWAKSILNARRQECLAPIRDFLFNFPWSRSRIAAETGLEKWFGVFKTTECLQKSQAALSACALTQGVMDGAFDGVGRIVVSPKRLPLSPAGITDCSAPAGDSAVTEGYLATGDTLSEARLEIATRQRAVALDKGKTWDSLVLTQSNNSLVSDIQLQTFEDEALTKPIAVDTPLCCPPLSPNPGAPFVVKDSLGIDQSALEKVYQPGTHYKINDIARITVAGKFQEVFVRLPGNSTTEPVDMGTLLASVTIPVGQGTVPDSSAEEVVRTLRDLLERKRAIFFVSVEFESPKGDSEFPSLAYNDVLNILFSKFNLSANQIVSSRRTTTKVTEDGIKISVFGI
jgi:hypothetical protein